MSLGHSVKLHISQLSHRVWDSRSWSNSLRKYLDSYGITDALAFLGLRGRMEAGWSRMNDLIVIQASQVREIYLQYDN